MKIREISSREILQELNEGRLSVLKELGAYKLKREMQFAGSLVDILINLILFFGKRNDVRQSALHILKFFFPSTLKGAYPKSAASVVIGFNHPSLGEIFRLIYIAVIYYPDREFFFPVNLPWYECLVPSLDKIRRLNISLVPMITPSTEKKLSHLLGDDSEKMADVKYLKNMFERNYMRKASESVKKKSIIFVAPSATRQTKVIGEHIHPTMTLLAHIIYRKNEAETIFVPTAVVPPKHGTRLVNIFRKYVISPCSAISPGEVIELTTGSRQFDYIFLKRINDRFNEITG